MKVLKAGPLYDEDGNLIATLLCDVYDYEPVEVRHILLPSGKHPQEGDVIPESLLAAFERQSVEE